MNWAFRKSAPRTDANEQLFSQQQAIPETAIELLAYEGLEEKVVHQQVHHKPKALLLFQE